MIALAFAVAVAASPAPAVPANTVTARSFLEAFAVNPKEAKRFTTQDAMMVMGDIGGPFDDYVKIIVREKNFLATCRVGEVRGKPAPSAEEQKDPDLDPRLKHGSISVFDGTYSCPQTDGSNRKVEFTVVLRDDLVLDFYLGGDR